MKGEETVQLLARTGSDSAKRLTPRTKQLIQQIALPLLLFSPPPSHLNNSQHSSHADALVKNEREATTGSETSLWGVWWVEEESWMGYAE